MNILTSQKKTRKYMKYYNSFIIPKRIRKKNRLIKDKVQIENADMRIINQPQQFHNKFHATNCQPVIGG